MPREGREESAPLGKNVERGRALGITRKPDIRYDFKVPFVL
jgi:hypothetical protein